MASPVALVTGAARGIGAAVAARLLDDGYRVVIADHDLIAGTSARFVLADVGEECSVNDLVAGIEREEVRLDLLICNAGIMIRKPIAALTLVEWSRVLSTNLTSCFLLARAAQGNRVKFSSFYEAFEEVVIPPGRLALSAQGLLADWPSQ